jgi:hypothetical protein
MTGPDDLILYGLRVTKEEYVQAYREYRPRMDTPTMTPADYVSRKRGAATGRPELAPGSYEHTVIDDWLLEAGLIKIKDARFRTETRMLAAGLGPEFLAELLGGSAEEWTDGAGPVPHHWQEFQKVYEAWYAWTAVADAQGPDAARTWLNADRRSERLRAGDNLRDEARGKAVEGRQIEVNVTVRPAAKGRWAAEGWWEVTVAEVPDFRMFILKPEDIESQSIDGLAKKTRDWPERFIVKNVVVEATAGQSSVTEAMNEAREDDDLDSEEATTWMTENAKKMLAEVDWDEAPSGLTPAGRFRFAATEQAWREIEAEFGLLTAEEVADRIGWSVDEVQTAHRNGHILAVHRGGQFLFPGFQLKTDGIHQAFARLRRAAAHLDVREASVLLWMISPTTWWTIEGSRPVDHLDDPKVVAAFESRFGVEW